MNWMLLPPSANMERHIEDKDVSDGDVWTDYMHAGWDFCRQMLAGAGRAASSDVPHELLPPARR